MEEMTTEQASQYLGLSRQTISKLVKERKLTAYVKTGNKNYFLKSDLDKYQESKNELKPRSPKTLALALAS